MVGYLLELPVVFAKKKKPVTMENMLTTSVYSFTKDRSYDVCVSKDFLSYRGAVVQSVNQSGIGLGGLRFLHGVILF